MAALKHLLLAAALCAAAAAALPPRAAAADARMPILDMPGAPAAHVVVDEAAGRMRFAEPKAAEAAAAAAAGGEEKKAAAAAAEQPKKKKQEEEKKKEAGETQKSGEFKAAEAADRFQPSCDLAADSSICLFGGKKVLLPEAVEKRVVGWYSFDSSHLIDQSGFQNHGSAVVPPGPGRLGRGASAYFDGDVWMEVPQSQSLGQAARRATASFWVYLRPDADFGVDADCSSVLLGSPDGAAWQVGFNPKQRVLTAAALKGNVKVRSFAKLRVAQWTHVALVLGRDTLKLYVNGIPDAVAQVGAAADGAAGAYGKLNLYAGRIPWESATCHVPMLVDDLRVYARAVTEYEIGASSFGALGAVDPAYVRLGKVGATFDEAQAACKESYHLCSRNDLYAGALQTARAMGWGKSADGVWEGGQPKPAKNPSEKRLALCCNDA